MTTCNATVTYGEPNPATKRCERLSTHDVDHFWLRGKGPVAIGFQDGDHGVKPHEEPLLSDEDREALVEQLLGYFRGQIDTEEFIDEALPWLDEALRRRREQSGVRRSPDDGEAEMMLPKTTPKDGVPAHRSTTT